MRKLFFDKINEDSVVITGDEHKHIAYSLRMRKGDALVICCDGVDYSGKITEITKDKTFVEIVGKEKSSAEPYSEITLFFGAMKGDKNDYVVQKCVELGVKKFVPFTSDYCAVKSESIKCERLNRISLESAKQSGRGFVPTVEEVIKFNDLLDLLGEYDLVIFPYENEEDCDIREFVANKQHERVAVIVGSEGGFSNREADELRRIAGGSVTLGSRILRADTASVAVVSALMYEWGEWRRKG